MRKACAARWRGEALDQKTYNALTGLLFLIGAAVHALRLVFGWPMQIGDANIPVWASWLGLIFAGALAYFGLRLTFRR